MAPRHAALTTFTALAVLFILAPLAIVVVNSFSSVSYNVFPPPGYSTRWYVNLAAQSDFYGAALRSIVLALLACCCALTVGIPTAYALARARLPGAGVVRAFVLAPIVTPNIVLGVALFMFFIRLGVAEQYSSLVVTHTLVTYPFVVVVLSAAFANFDWSIEEAARDLGAGRTVTFFRVLLPEIRTSILISAIFAFVISFDQVETTLFLVRPGQETLPVDMFLYLQKRQDPTIAALSTVLIAFAGFLVAGLSLALSNRERTLTLLSQKEEVAP